jgi:hypothetical protein
MSTLVVNTTRTEDGRDIYSFDSRGTSYTVFQREKNSNELFEVFSERKSASFGLQIKLMTFNEMKTRSIALKNLTTLIAA